jgi:eukaryotic-like serine/threonine-protein kinase
MAGRDRFVAIAVELLGDRYEILRPIGTGALTQVLEGFDRREHRRVALKLPIRGLAEDGAFLERLERETRSAASLVHPNIAAVYGMGRDTRTGFVVAELVAGCSLEGMLTDRGPLPAAGAARIAIDVCAALEAAHACGLAHGHLTPSNILLAIDGTVKVTDFRLAQAASRSDTVPAPADDLAALGRCLAAMLIGRGVAVGAPIQLGSEVPAQLVELVSHMAGDPQRLRGSAGDLGRELNRFLARGSPRIAAVASAALDAPGSRPGLATPRLRATGQLVPVAAASPAPTVTAAKGPAWARRVVTLAVASLIVGCLGAATGLVNRQSPAPLDNQAVTPASTAIVATTTSVPRSHTPATTAAPTTTAANAAPLPTPRQSTTTRQRIGSGQRIVPAVVGLHRQQAADLLAQAQLTVRMIPIQVSDSRQVQRVVAQRPSAGQSLPAGSAVTVLIGSRKPTA